MQMNVPDCECNTGGLCSCADYSAFVLANEVLQEIDNMYLNYPEAVAQMSYRRLEGFKTYVSSMIAGNVSEDKLALKQIYTELRDRMGYPKTRFGGVYVGWSGLTC